LDGYEIGGFGYLKILVVGAGVIGAKVIKQLRRNPSIEIRVVDSREVPFSVEEGIIEKVDYQVELRPVELEQVIMEVKPDIVLVTTSPQDISKSSIPGLEILVEALRIELESASKVPIIAVSRSELS
jgi:hypothetical protein